MTGEPSADSRWSTIRAALAGPLAGMDDLADRSAEAVIEALQEQENRRPPAGATLRPLHELTLTALDDATQTMATAEPIAPAAERCQAQDHPVWTDGTMGHYRCRRAAGHAPLDADRPGHVSIEEDGWWEF